MFINIFILKNIYIAINTKTDMNKNANGSLMVIHRGTVTNKNLNENIRYNSTPIILVF